MLSRRSMARRRFSRLWVNSISANDDLLRSDHAGAADFRKMPERWYYFGTNDLVFKRCLTHFHWPGT
jgi:hypothetical protein